MDAGDVFERGTEADASTEKEYTAPDLEPDTRYTVFAAVSSTAGVALERAAMTTSDSRVASVTIRIDQADKTSVTFTLSPSGADQCWYAVTPAGQTLDAAALQRDGKQADATREAPYTVDGLTPGSGYHVYAVSAFEGRAGEVASMDFATAEEKLQGLTADVTGKEFTYVARSHYFGDLHEKNTGWFVYNLRDNEPDANGNYPKGTASLWFELHADLAACGDGILPAGTYTVRDEITPGTCLPGKIIQGWDEGSYDADVTYYQCSGEWGIVDGGRVTVETTTDGYRVAFDFTTQDGHRITASYAGTLVAENIDPIDPDATTTLRDNYDIRFAEGVGTLVNAYYYGFDETLKADLWSVYMEPVVKNSESDGFMMDLLVDPALGYAAGFPAGTADAPDEYGISYYGEPGHYLPGEYDADGVMIHTWYLGGYLRGPGDEWLVTKYAAAKMGYIYISRAEDMYTITVEYSDENWRTVTGTWTGPLTTHDMTVAPQTVPRRMRAAR